METKIFTRAELYTALAGVMNFESEGIFQEALDILSKGKSVVVDNLCYSGNGRYAKITDRGRYAYKLIVPICDKNGCLYSTDSFKIKYMENAIRGKYAIYRHTRQMVIGIMKIVDTDYSDDRFDYGYTDEHYGRYKVIVE